MQFLASLYRRSSALSVTSDAYKHVMVLLWNNSMACWYILRYSGKRELHESEDVLK